jgi:hypothetical protein
MVTFASFFPPKQFLYNFATKKTLVEAVTRVIYIKNKTNEWTVLKAMPDELKCLSHVNWNLELCQGRPGPWRLRFSVGWVPALVDIQRNELGLICRTETRTRSRSFQKELNLLCAEYELKLRKNTLFLKWLELRVDSRLIDS